MGDQETYDITQLIRKLHRDQQLTIVLIEHDMRVVFHLADRIWCWPRATCWRKARRRRSPPTRPCRPPIWERRRHDRSAEAEDLHTYYGKSHILHGVSLEVREGEIVACSAVTAPARPPRCAA